MTNAEEILAVVPDGMIFTLGAYEITLTNPQAIGKMFSADLVIRREGVVVFEDDARVVNPPLLVPDPSGDIIYAEHILINPITEEEETIPEARFSRDPLTAIKEIIENTILVLIK
ncbi:MAG: hypothetical protein V7727_19805 [Sneathiella sp.]